MPLLYALATCLLLLRAGEAVGRLPRLPPNGGLQAVTPRDLAGCWQVVPGVVGEGRPEPNWKQYSRVLGALGTANRNFQYFSSPRGVGGESRAFVNLSEFFGSSVFAYTEGTYAPLKTKGQLEATVTAINVRFLGLQLRINVGGKGVVSVRYADKRQRVFENEDGAVVLQEKVEIPKEYADIFM